MGLVKLCHDLTRLPISPQKVVNSKENPLSKKSRLVKILYNLPKWIDAYNFSYQNDEQIEDLSLQMFVV